MSHLQNMVVISMITAKWVAGDHTASEEPVSTPVCWVQSTHISPPRADSGTSPGKQHLSCNPSLPQADIYIQGVDTYCFCLPSNHSLWLWKQHPPLSQTVRFSACETFMMGEKIYQANVSPELLGRFLGTSQAHEGGVEKYRITDP